MNIREKIYSGIFVLAVVGATVLLNSPSVRNGSTANQIVEQDSKKYNAVEINTKDVQLAIEELEEE